MDVRRVDTTQFINRLRSRDFDMISGGYSANAFPSSQLKVVWHSQYIDSTYNMAGVSGPAIDYLTEKIDGLMAIFKDITDKELKEVEDKEVILEKIIYFAPAGYHIAVEGDYTFSLSIEEKRPPE